MKEAQSGGKEKDAKAHAKPQSSAAALTPEPHDLAASLLGLQRTHGNRFVVGALEARAIQAKGNGARSASLSAKTETATQAVAAQGLEGQGKQLPYLDSIQRVFGRHDVTNAKAHFGSRPAEANHRLGALAFTYGHHVAFAAHPSLHTAAHEAAHVIQQRSGVHLKGAVGKADDAYERHADQVADRVVRGESAELLLDQTPHLGLGGAAIQRKPVGEPGRGEKIPLEQDPNWIYLSIIRIALDWLVNGVPGSYIDSKKGQHAKRHHGKHAERHHGKRPHSRHQRIKRAQAEAQRARADELRGASQALLTIMNEAAGNRIPWETPPEALERVANAWWVALGNVELVGDPEDPETIELALPYVSLVTATDLAKLSALYSGMMSLDMLKVYGKVEEKEGEKKEGTETGTLLAEAAIGATHVADLLADWFIEAKLIAPAEGLIMSRKFAVLVSAADPGLLTEWSRNMLKLDPHKLEESAELWKAAKHSLKPLTTVGKGAAVVGALINILEGVLAYYEQKELFEKLMRNEGKPMIRDCRMGRETVRRLHEDLPPFVTRNAAAVGISPANYAFLALIEQYQHNDLSTDTGRPDWSGLFASTQAHSSEILAALKAYLDHVGPTAEALAKWYKVVHRCQLAFASAGLDVLTLIPVVNLGAVIASVIILIVKATGLDQAEIDWELSFVRNYKVHRSAPYITVNLETLFASAILTRNFRALTRGANFAVNFALETWGL